jgi:cell division protein FtsX
MRSFRVLVSVEIFVDAEDAEKAREQTYEIVAKINAIDGVNDTDYITIEDEGEEENS